MANTASSPELAPQVSPEQKGSSPAASTTPVPTRGAITKFLQPKRVIVEQPQWSHEDSSFNSPQVPRKKKRKDETKPSCKKSISSSFNVQATTGATSAEPTRPEGQMNDPKPPRQEASNSDDSVSKSSSSSSSEQKKLRKKRKLEQRQEGTIATLQPEKEQTLKTDSSKHAVSATDTSHRAPLSDRSLVENAKLAQEGNPVKKVQVAPKLTEAKPKQGLSNDTAGSLPSLSGSQKETKSKPTATDTSHRTPLSDRSLVENAKLAKEGKPLKKLQVAPKLTEAKPKQGLSNGDASSVPSLSGSQKETKAKPTATDTSHRAPLSDRSLVENAKLAKEGKPLKKLQVAPKLLESKPKKRLSNDTAGSLPSLSGSQKETKSKPTATDTSHQTPLSDRSLVENAKLAKEGKPVKKLQVAPKLLEAKPKKRLSNGDASSVPSLSGSQKETKTKPTPTDTSHRAPLSDRLLVENVKEGKILTKLQVAPKLLEAKPKKRLPNVDASSVPSLSGSQKETKAKSLQAKKRARGAEKKAETVNTPIKRPRPEAVCKYGSPLVVLPYYRKRY
jgi:hypothetical protein